MSKRWWVQVYKYIRRPLYSKLCDTFLTTVWFPYCNVCTPWSHDIPTFRLSGGAGMLWSYCSGCWGGISDSFIANTRFTCGGCDMKILIKYNYYRYRIIEDFNNSFIRNADFRKLMMFSSVGCIIGLFLALILLALNFYLILKYCYYNQPVMNYISQFIGFAIPSIFLIYFLRLIWRANKLFHESSQ